MDITIVTDEIFVQGEFLDDHHQTTSGKTQRFNIYQGRKFHVRAEGGER